MTFVALEELSSPSKIAIFKICLGNVLFVVFGIALIGLASYYIVRDNVVRIISGYITGSTEADTQGLLDDTTYSFIVSLCIILLATGIGIAIVSLIGFCGAVQRNPHCMLGYVVFLVILIIAQSTALALFGAFKSKIDTNLAQYLSTGTLSKEYSFGQGKQSGLTAAFDYIQMHYNCCGIISAADYNTTFTAWRSTYRDSVGDERRLPIPPFCCKFKEGKKLEWQDILEIEAQRQWDFESLHSRFAPYLQSSACLTSSVVNLRSAWANKGCYRSFQEKVLKPLYKMLAGMAIGFVVFEVLCLLAACVLMCDVNTVKNVAEQEEEQNLALKTERETILAGIQATGSLAAYAMTGPSPSTMPLAARASAMGGFPRAQPSMMGGFPRAQPSIRGPIRQSTMGGPFGAQPSMMGSPFGAQRSMPGMQPGMMGGPPGAQPSTMGGPPGAQLSMMGGPPGAQLSMMGGPPGAQPGMTGESLSAQQSMTGGQPVAQPDMTGLLPGAQLGMTGAPLMTPLGTMGNFPGAQPSMMRGPTAARASTSGGFAGATSPSMAGPFSGMSGFTSSMSGMHSGMGPSRTF